MKKINLQHIYKYVEKHISIFHQRRLNYVQKKVDLFKILKQKNPYLFKAKNILTAQDLVKSFLDAFLQSQEETLFGDFIEGLSFFVCDKVIEKDVSIPFKPSFLIRGIYGKYCCHNLSRRQRQKDEIILA